MAVDRNCFCELTGENYPDWDSFNLIIWKTFPERFGGGDKYRDKYKDSWIIYNRPHIFVSANKYLIPPELLAGIAWIEVGGDPVIVDRTGFYARSFDWSGPDWIDNNLTVTTHPSRTSFGAVSIQLRTAARELGIDAEKMSFRNQMDLIRCLENNASNLDIVAKHLKNLILYDYPGTNTFVLTDEQIIVVGSRYNRGTARKLSDIINSITLPPGSPGREYSEHGRALLRRTPHIMDLLEK